MKNSTTTIWLAVLSALLAIIMNNDMHMMTIAQAWVMVTFIIIAIETNK